MANKLFDKKFKYFIIDWKVILNFININFNMRTQDNKNIFENKINDTNLLYKKI